MLANIVLVRIFVIIQLKYRNSFKLFEQNQNNTFFYEVNVATTICLLTFFLWTFFLSNTELY